MNRNQAHKPTPGREFFIGLTYGIAIVIPVWLLLVSACVAATGGPK